MGSRHSWSKGIVTGDTVVSLAKMNRILNVDRDALLVRVQAGATLKELIAHLDERGLALENLGSISEQSLAGAMSTATHGTGIEFRCLASQVESLKLIDGEGNERELRRTDAAFNAVITGLGCFGIIHEMTLRVVPSFQMRTVTGSARFDDVIGDLDAYVRGSDHFKLWWFVPDERVILFRNTRTTAPPNDSDLTRWFNDELVAVIVYRALVSLQGIHRKALVPRMNRFLVSTAGRHQDRICKSYLGFLTPVPPVHRETEWAFDYAGAKELLREYRDLLVKSGHTYNFVQEIRFTKGDDFWLSPAYGRDSVWLSMYNMDKGASWDAQLREFETFARARGGRPHWGKEASVDAAYVAKQWPKLGAFRELAKAYDPPGKFVNEWILQLLWTP